jgi:hypothetical protein
MAPVPQHRKRLDHRAVPVLTDLSRRQRAGKKHDKF